MADDVYPQLTEIFRNVFDDDTIVAAPELTARDVPGWDSLSHIRLMLSVERAFRVKFSAAEVGKLNTVGDLAALVQKKTSTTR